MTVYLATGQTISYSTPPYDLTFFPEADLTLHNDIYSIFTTDSYRAFEISNNYIFTLGNNNIVQVYLRANPSLLLQSYTQSSFLSTSEEMVYLSFDQDENFLVLTSSTNDILKHHVHSIGTDGALTLLYVRGDLNFTKIPVRTYMKSTEVYTFFQGSNQLYITNITSNASHFVTLPISKLDARVTPDRSKAILWDTSNG
jgi:ABC-type uncharacterized transport system permease subunit